MENEISTNYYINKQAADCKQFFVKRATKKRYCKIPLIC